MSRIIVLENIRSAYNVGNVIRTADALGRDVWLVGYTPSPFDTPKVQKTSLGAENNVNIQRFDTTEQMLNKLKEDKIYTIAAEITDNAEPLNIFEKNVPDKLAVVFGNEVDGVHPDTLKAVDKIVFIPMLGIKVSLNIGQSAAIFMRATKI